ncbi:hypothetical protein SAMN05445504_7721 [Burkholderia sp. CF099]|nr:hypothetical protein SAMN05445504_7721 [Burkholderia sp. CF099]
MEMTESQHFINDLYVAADATFAPAVYPIYGFVEGADPVVIGTCFAIEYRGRKFLVSAAHVIDDHRKATLALAPVRGGEPITVEGQFYIVNPGDKLREDDPFDFAWHELTTEEALKIDCIPERNLEDDRTSGGGTCLYIAMGFPASKNKKISPANRAKRLLVPNRARYMNVETDATEYFEFREMSSETHIAIERENRSHSLDGVEENTIGHKGLSGGPLINTGARLNPASLGRPKVSGILIENDEKRKIIVALRLSVVLRHIDSVVDAGS